MLTTVNAPYVYTYCPACSQPIRFTLKTNPDGTLIYEPGQVGRGLQLHLVHACEAVQR